MESETVPDAIRAVYKRPRIESCRISRMEEKALGSFSLDSPTAWRLGTNNIGVFVGEMPALGRTIEILEALEDPAPDAPKWVLVAATKKMAAVICQRWFISEKRRVAASTLKLPQVRANIWLCTPETLKKAAPADPSRIAGLLLIDMLCQVHKARGLDNGAFHVRNDRPQNIANYRSSLCVDGWSPPLFVLSQKPAKSVWTDTVARSYCLEALWFLDGKTFTCSEREDASVAE